MNSPETPDLPGIPEKPLRKAVATLAITKASQGTNHDATLGRGSSVTVRIPWEVYRRLLTQFWVR